MKLDKHNEAWMILTVEERTSLSLQFSYEKSTWQAGEIMGKAHYKYLEIKARAEKYLRLFTEHFNVFTGLIPNDIKLDPLFEEYLTLIIYKRLTPFDAVNKMQNKALTIASHRDELINKEFTKLQKQEKFSAQALLNLMLDFDRWNNFRILPKNLQEPSAFKRRNKNRLKKQLKNLTDINPFVLEKIIQKFDITHKELKDAFYIPLVKNGEYQIIQVDPKLNANLNQINKLGLFMFESSARAGEFAELVSTFNINEPKDCKQGLIFWPQYRILIKGALNYHEIENINPSRRYLELALRDWDSIMVNNMKKKASLQK